MKQYFEIVDVSARKVMDLALNPTVEVEVTLDDGTVGRASAPSGMQNAKDVSIAVDNVNMEIAEALIAMNALEQVALDALMLEIDMAEDASRLGANAVLAASLACAKAAAASSGLSLYNYIGGVNARAIPKVVKEGDAVCLSSYATLSRFMEAASARRAEGKKLIISAGSGETEDPILADIAVALNADGIITSSSAVINQLMRIEEELYDMQ